MRTSPSFSTTPPHTYERIGHRLRDLVSAPKAQRLQCVTVRRLKEEDPADWRRVINEIAGTAGVKVEDLGNEAYRIAWSDYCDY
ncbi:DUF1654 domain-containing protein [Pseudomonas cichorii]|uniref:DUF1654 domain-containing protein n=1 Tax=Pseudomonas cichorii TaxID=36746 RepID=A0ABQ1DIK6_PSECI|nr:DUF1654 domain-containing protein [Pseudomonas cichorii]AHF68717.1 hypothetical protein PCH70_35640 [Pseudomonas cichorii JBC1]QVE15715.1 DUF1654 domain-containing protein [Pseudomonas cichorii]GFM90823.1 hypothetical protein PSCICP_07950 [Pseudomonas cichorii]SDN32503.1 Protein of unknown function [Pseudomonas cichorii]